MKDNFKICSCNDCESMYFRAIEIVKKFELDGECPQGTIAMSIILQGLATRITQYGKALHLQNEGAPTPFAAAIAQHTVMALVEGIADQVCDYLDANDAEVFNTLIRIHNDAYNARHPDGLPKDGETNAEITDAILKARKGD